MSLTKSSIFPPGPEPPPDWENRFHTIPHTRVTLCFSAWSLRPSRHESDVETIFERMHVEAFNAQYSNEPMRLSPHSEVEGAQYFSWVRGSSAAILFLKLDDRPISNITWDEMSFVAIGLDQFRLAYPKVDVIGGIYRDLADESGRPSEDLGNFKITSVPGPRQASLS